MFSFFSKTTRTKIGDTIVFGRYPQGCDERLSGIEWLVLDIKDKQALLISKQSLITSPYCRFEAGKENWSSLEWTLCYARNQLNNVFYKDAFNPKERSKIKPRTTIWSSYYHSCNDYVFLLDETECEHYFPTLESRITYPTEHCIHSGARIDMNPAGACCWWLLPFVEDHADSLGNRAIYPKAVFQNGEIQYHSRNVYHSDFTLRPSIIISLD